MAQYNIGPRIGIEGEAQFRSQISRINSEYRSMDSYLKAVEKSMEQQGVTQERLALKSNALRQQIDAQNRAYAEYSNMLAKIKALEGDHTAEITRYEGALLHTESTLTDLKTALAKTEQEMADLANSVQHIETAAERAERNLGEYRQEMTRLNDEYDAATAYTQAVSRSMDATGASMEGLSNKATGLYRQLDLQQQRFDNLHNALRAATALYGENSAEVLRYEAALEDVKSATAQLERELADTDRQLENLANGIEDVGDSADSAEPKVLSFGDMLKAGVASGSILNTIERVGEVVVEIGSKAIEAAAEVKAANAQFQQTFGELEGRASSALDSISDKTGIAVTRLQGGYTALYAFTKSVGGDQETALNIAQRALTAAADSAAYYDRSMEDATETLQSFLKGNYENDAALGIAATETTRNAKANELYAKSFKDLTEAQKVDTLLAMVEAGNAASGALGQAAREADSWANVTGEAAEASRQLLAQLGSPILAGLTPLIQGYTKALQEMTRQSSWEQLRTDIDGFQAALAEADATLADSNGKMAATAGVAEQYVRRLEEIEAAGLNTADAQREYAQTVDLLNATVPGLNLTIDRNTGYITQNTDAIRVSIRAMKEQAEQQAKQAYYKRIIDEQAKAYEALYAAQVREQELLAQKEQLLSNGAQLYDSMSYAQAGSAQAMAHFNAQLTEEDRALAAVVLELNTLGGEIRVSEEAISAFDSQIQTSAAALGDYAEAGDTAADAAARQSQAQQDLAKEFEAARLAARESIDSQIGLFQELADENDWTAEKIIKNWEKQQEAFANYEDNLKKATELGLDETLVAQLSDGSQQSMMILDALVNDTELSVDEINAAFGGLNKSKESLSTTLAEMKTIISQRLGQLVKYAEAAGLDIVNGASNGILNNIGKYEQALRRLASRGQQAYKHEWSINSPSRVMQQLTEYIPDAAVMTIERRTPDYERAMAEFASAGQVAYQDKLDAVAQYPSVMQGVPGYGGTTTNTRNVAYGGISININAQAGQDLNAIADAVVQRLTVELGQKEAAF